MSSGQTSAEFQATTSRLLGTLLRVTDMPSLLGQAAWLLGAEVVFVVRRANGELMGTFPEAGTQWIRANLTALRGWLLDEDFDERHEGFSNEGPVSVRDHCFSDALVALGGVLPRRSPPELALYAFKGRETAGQFRTFHCGAAAALLRQFEHIQAVHEKDAATKRSDEERLLKEFYSSLVGRDVLRSVSWGTFVRTVAKGTLDPPGINTLMGAAAVLWTGYRVRSGVKEQSRPGDQTEAQEWLNGIGTDEASPFLDALEFLLNDSHITKRLAELTARLHSQSEESRKAAVVVLEHAWRLVLQATIEGVESPPCLPNSQELTALLWLTSKLVANALCASDRCGFAGPSNHEGPHSALNCGQVIELGRDQMRLYFVVLLIHSSSLRRRYMGLDGGDGPNVVPFELQRNYNIHLSRYILGCVEILQGMWGVDATPAVVSRAECLDSLLYLVDRFAHIECGVDERLHIKEQIGRGLPAEVQHHLTKPQYRDHLLHVVDVFLLGHVLLNMQLRWIDGKERTLGQHFAVLERANETDHTQGETPGVWLRDWAIASLLHDIGYQAFLVPINGEKKAPHPFFKLRGQVRLEWLEVKLMSSRQCLQELAKQLVPSDHRPVWLPERWSSELNDHGVLSALRIAQLLVHAGTSGSVGESGYFKLIDEHIRALHAIAHHNLFAHTANLATHPLTCLLRLCDELQEWSRRRVNIEQTVKNLYIQIEEAGDSGLQGTESLESLLADISVELIETPDGDLVQFKSGRVGTQLCFYLLYKDSIENHFDSSTTFLSKAYNLQHVNLCTDRAVVNEVMEWRIELGFPRPAEYRGLSELDIYGLVAERSRAIPLLLEYSDLQHAASGLVILRDDGSGMDRVAIVVSGGADEKLRCGWLPRNPAELFEELVMVKREILVARALGLGRPQRRTTSP